MTKRKGIRLLVALALCFMLCFSFAVPAFAYADDTEQELPITEATQPEATPEPEPTEEPEPYEGEPIDDEGMANKTAATFIGHSECYGLNRDNIRPKVIKLIELGVTDFYSGGMGSFDWMCAHVVYDLKKDYPQLNNHLVIPYLTFNILEKKYFDSIIYPEGFEKYHFKAAIPARNRYLVDNAKYALCYITHGWGGAAQTFERAKEKGPVIINLGEKDTSP